MDGYHSTNQVLFFDWTTSKLMRPGRVGKVHNSSHFVLQMKNLA